MIDPQVLARVKRAATAKRRADEQYRAALVAALEAGMTYSDLAKALGQSKQRVRQYLTYTPKRTDS